MRSIRGKTGLSFDGFQPGASTRMSGGAGAAAMASVAENFGALNEQSTDWAQFGRTAIQADGLLKRTAQDATSLIERGRIANDAAIEIAENNAKYTSKMANKQTQRSMTGGIIQAGVGLLGSALLSDERAKNTINKIEDALTTLRDLKPVTFYYNEEYSCNPERLHHGFIAQEYKEVLPSATYYDESSDRFCIDTHELVALLVRGIQQLEDRVARLEATKALAGVK